MTIQVKVKHDVGNQAIKIITQALPGGEVTHSRTLAMGEEQSFCVHKQQRLVIEETDLPPIDSP